MDRNYTGFTEIFMLAILIIATAYNVVGFTNTAIYYILVAILISIVNRRN